MAEKDKVHHKKIDSFSLKTDYFQGFGKASLKNASKTIHFDFTHYSLHHNYENIGYVRVDEAMLWMNAIVRATVVHSLAPTLNSLPPSGSASDSRPLVTRDIMGVMHEMIAKEVKKLEKILASLKDEAGNFSKIRALTELYEILSFASEEFWEAQNEKEVYFLDLSQATFSSE